MESEWSSSASPQATNRYREAYQTLSETLLRALDNVTNEELCDSFVAEALQQIKRTQAITPEFFPGEFFNRFKPAMLARTQTEIDACKAQVRKIQEEAKTASAHLTERLHAAMASGDELAQHEIWRERDLRQAEAQEAIDAETQRISLIQFRLQAFTRIGQELGIISPKQSPGDARSPGSEPPPVMPFTPIVPLI
jgi:hypothetical protein